jgi:GTP-binding protein YchF
LKVALIGLLQSGKSTLFSAISGRAAAPAGSTNIEEAIVSVPDDRLDFLTAYYKPKKVTHATIDCLDVPGFDLSSEHGRAAARRLINHIRTVDLLVLVVRSFDEPAVPAYMNRINPDADVNELRTELMLGDLELVETRIEKLQKQILKPTQTRTQDKAELALHQKLEETIEQEKPIKDAIESDSELATIKSLGFMTLKPIVVAVNIGEDSLGERIGLPGAGDSADVVGICAKLEYELAQLDEQSRADFMKDLGIVTSAKDKLVRSCYSALGLISFLTVVSGELRAWPIQKGTIALEAAGKIHSDIKRGFIKAEVFGFDDLQKFGSEKEIKAAGRIRLEGKDYIVADGDVINFKFNV